MPRGDEEQYPINRESDDDDVSRRNEGSVNSESCLPLFLGKGSTLLVSHDHRASGMFLLGMLAQDWRPQQPSDAAKLHIYSPDSEDCLLFHYEFTGMIKLNQVVCELNAVDSISYVEDDFHLEIDEVVYHECVTELSRIPTKESSTIGEDNSATTFQRAISKAPTQISPVKASSAK